MVEQVEPVHGMSMTRKEMEQVPPVTSLTFTPVESTLEPVRRIRSYHQEPVGNPINGLATCSRIQLNLLKVDIPISPAYCRTQMIRTRSPMRRRTLVQRLLTLATDSPFTNY